MDYSAAKTMQDQINIEATEWLLRLEETENPPNAWQQSEFFAWLRRSPEHVKAFFETADLWRGLESFDPHKDVDVEKILSGNVTRFAAVPHLPAAARNIGRTKAHASSRIGRRPKKWHMVAAAAALGGCALLAVWQAERSPAYTTALGEQRIVKLSDGSVLHLNTQSRVKVRFSDKQRLVELLQGEALFTVERDASRPFSVQTPNSSIRALGTQFNVLNRSNTDTVVVVEGIVQVSQGKAPGTRLLAGEGAKIAGSAVTKHRIRDVATTVAWRERRLIFDNVSLAEVATEFNRYNKVQFHVQGTIGQSKRLTGIFSADHPQSLILYLQKESDLNIEQKNNGITVRQN